MKKLLKHCACGLLFAVGSLFALVLLVRYQAVQYLAAYAGHGFANSLPAAPAETTAAGSTGAACTSLPLNVVTYNVRYGSHLIEALRKPLGNHAPGDYQPWSVRYPAIRSLLDGYAPDLIGLQEMHTDADIANIVPLQQYTLVSYHLNAFHYGDAALLFRSERFELLDSGQLWLGPDSRLPLGVGFNPLAMIRYVNWAMLQEKSSGFRFLFVNTHFDNNSLNREKSAELFRRQIASLSADYPMVVVGDFNSNAATPRYQRLIGARDAEPLLINAHDLLPTASNDDAGGPDQLIDHILVGGPCSTRVADWRVDQRRLDSGDTLSDHNPVLAQLQFTGQKGLN